MKLFIPEIGTSLRLEQDWTFTLYVEYRNSDLFRKLNLEDKNQIIELPKGLVIKVDRIYIRKGNSQYSSITFRVPKPKNKMERELMPHNDKLSGSKFWVKLHEINGTEFSIDNKNEETKELFLKFYERIEKECILKLRTQDNTKLLSEINRLLPSGSNLNNFSTYESYDQFLNKMINKIDRKTFMKDYLHSNLKQEIRDYKLSQLNI